MAQIINDMDFGSMLGRQLGTGLSKGLGTLAQYKMNEILKKQREAEAASAFKALGTPDEQAFQLSQFPESVQKELIKGMREYLPYGDLLNKQEGVTSPMASFNQSQQQIPEEVMRSISATSPMDHIVTNYLNSPNVQQNYKTQQPAQVLKPLPQESQYKPPVRPRNLAEAKLFQQQRKEQMALDKEARIEQRAIDRENAPFIKETRDKYKSALEDERRLNRMEELINTKNLSRPRFVSLLNTLKKGVWGIGLDFTSALTPETQEYDKLTQEFIKGAKNIFGSRITDADLNAFMRLLPDLSKDREGKRRVIHNMRLTNEAAKIKSKIMDDIIKQNGGRIPRNLNMLVEEQADQPLQLLADRFKEGYQKPPKEKGIAKALMPKIPSPLNFIFGKG